MTIHQGDQHAIAFSVKDASDIVHAELILGGMTKDYPGELVIKGKDIFFPLSREESLSLTPGYYDLFWQIEFANGTVSNNFCTDFLEVIRTPNGRTFYE